MATVMVISLHLCIFFHGLRPFSLWLILLIMYQCFTSNVFKHIFTANFWQDILRLFNTILCPKLFSIQAPWPHISVIWSHLPDYFYIFTLQEFLIHWSINISALPLKFTTSNNLLYLPSLFPSFYNIYLTFILFVWSGSIPRREELTSVYHNYPLKGLNLRYMYCSQKQSE